MKYYIVLVIFLSTARLAQMPIKEQLITNDEENNHEIILHSIYTVDILLDNRYKTKTPCYIKIMGNLGLNYNGIEAATFEFTNIDNFNNYTTNLIDEQYQKHRNTNLSQIKHQFIINFALFNTCQIQYNNWIPLLIGHPLYDSCIATYYNSNCEDENIMFNIYHQPTQDSYNLAIIHKSATIEGFFRWSGIVTIGKDTKIGYGVCLKNGVLISSECIINDHVSVGRYTMIGYNTLISRHIDIGERNLIGNDVAISKGDWFKDKNPIDDKQKINRLGGFDTKETRWLNLGNSNVFFSGASWLVQSEPVNFLVRYRKSKREKNKET